MHRFLSLPVPLFFLQNLENTFKAENLGSLIGKALDDAMAKNQASKTLLSRLQWRGVYPLRSRVVSFQFHSQRSVFAWTGVARTRLNEGCPNHRNLFCNCIPQKIQAIVNTIEKMVSQSQIVASRTFFSKWRKIWI